MEYQGIDLSTAQQHCRPKSANFALDKQTAATLRYYLLVAAGWSSVAMGESVAFDSIKLSCGRNGRARDAWHTLQGSAAN
jgi:hypothetical protein